MITRTLQDSAEFKKLASAIEKLRDIKTIADQLSSIPIKKRKTEDMLAEIRKIDPFLEGQIALKTKKPGSSDEKSQECFSISSVLAFRISQLRTLYEIYEKWNSYKHLEQNAQELRIKIINAIVQVEYQPFGSGKSNTDANNAANEELQPLLMEIVDTFNECCSLSSNFGLPIILNSSNDKLKLIDTQPLSKTNDDEFPWEKTLAISLDILFVIAAVVTFVYHPGSLLAACISYGIALPFLIWGNMKAFDLSCGSNGLAEEYEDLNSPSFQTPSSTTGMGRTVSLSLNAHNGSPLSSSTSKKKAKKANPIEFHDLNADLPSDLDLDYDDLSAPPTPSTSS
jgi:hypothetical protein